MSGTLFYSDGSRKYLTQEERSAFLKASRRFPRDVESFCHVLAYTGCRLSEALALTADRVDLTAESITFETLKKRKRGVFRAVPIPPELVTMLDDMHDLRRVQHRKDKGRDTRRIGKTNGLFDGTNGLFAPLSRPPAAACHRGLQQGVARHGAVWTGG